MKREFLKELGLEKEVIDKIMDENGKDIEAAKGKNQDDKVKELEAEVNKLNESIKERDGQLETLKASAGDNEELKNKIAELEKSNKDAAESHKNEMAALKKSHAIESALKEANAKSIKAVMPFIDDSKISVDTNNNLIGLKEQIDSLKGADDTKFLFTSGKPSIKGATPGESGDPNDQPYTKAQIKAMSSVERSKLLADDPDTYHAVMDN